MLLPFTMNFVKLTCMKKKGDQIRAKLNWLKVEDKVYKELFKCIHPPIHATQFQDIHS